MDGVVFTHSHFLPFRDRSLVKIRGGDASFIEKHTDKTPMH
jgi:hypothetical protein